MAAGEEAIKILDNFQPADLVRNRTILYAINYAIQMVGEAANKVSRPSREESPEIPWLKFINLRHKLVHEYDDIDYEIIYKTVKYDIPPLLVLLHQLIDRFSENESAKG